MRLFGLNRRRSETLLLAIGQLVLIAYVFQVAAFDHWHTDISAVSGVVESSAHSIHADHCHGVSATCADAGGGFAQISPNQTIRLPSAAPSLELVTAPTGIHPCEVFIGTLPEPPRAT